MSARLHWVDWMKRTIERVQRLFHRRERRRLLARLDTLTQPENLVTWHARDEDDRDVEARS